MIPEATFQGLFFFLLDTLYVFDDRKHCFWATGNTVLILISAFAFANIQTLLHWYVSRYVLLKESSSTLQRITFWRLFEQFQTVRQCYVYIYHMTSRLGVK